MTNYVVVFNEADGWDVMRTSDPIATSIDPHIFGQRRQRALISRP